MDDKLTALIVEELGSMQLRNQIIEDVCVKGGLRWPDAELLVRLTEVEQAHAIVRRQGPWLIAISVVLILVGTVPYMIALYMIGLLLGLIPSPGPMSGGDIEITLPIASPSALMKMVREYIGEVGASLSLLPSGIIGLYQTVRRYQET